MRASGGTTASSTSPTRATTGCTPSTRPTTRYELLYDAAELGDDAPLTGVDNITVEEGSGDLVVAEDGGNMELVLITADREVAPFVRVVGHDASEVTGPAFSPDGTRLYFSSQRGAGTSGIGVTWEVTGPFRGVELRETAPDTTPSAPTTLRDVAQDAGAERRRRATTGVSPGGRRRGRGGGRRRGGSRRRRPPPARQHAGVLTGSARPVGSRP